MKYSISLFIYLDDDTFFKLMIIMIYNIYTMLTLVGHVRNKTSKRNIQLLIHVIFSISVHFNIYFIHNTEK